MPYRQRISSDNYWTSKPNTEFHDERFGWGKVSKTGKSILWESYKPLTKRQIAAEKRRIQKRIAWLKTPEGLEYIRRTDQVLDSVFAKNGTSRHEIYKTICDVIDKSSPIAALYSKIL